MCIRDSRNAVCLCRCRRLQALRDLAAVFLLHVHLARCTVPLSFNVNIACDVICTRNVRECLATFPFAPFTSVHPHSQSHFHDASDLIHIPVPLPKCIPIPSHSHCHQTNERHLSLNNQMMIKCSKCKHSTVLASKSRHTRTYICSQKRIWRTLEHFIGLQSHRATHAHMKSSHYHSHCHMYCSHSHSHFWHICVNPIPMHISNLYVVSAELAMPCNTL